MKDIDPNLPVNKTAALVVSKSNEHGVDFSGSHRISSMTPLPTTQFWGLKEHDLTGKKSGRFIVIGCSLWRPNNWKKSTNSVRWVVRCGCGRYEILTTKAVKKNHPDTMCVECIRFRRKKDEYYRLGI